MEVNGVLTPAELLDAKTARKIYEDIVRKARDPALFEYVGQRLFKVRIFPIEPRKEKEIRLKYTQLLPRDGNLVRYTCPLSTASFPNAYPELLAQDRGQIRQKTPTRHSLLPYSQSRNKT